MLVNFGVKMAMSKEAEKQIAQLQMFEQNLQQISMQKQQFQSQLLEVESALKGVDGTEQCYRIIGNLMVLSNKADIEKDLNSKKEVLDLRIKTVEKQENSLRQRAGDLRNGILKELSENGPQN